MLKSLQLAYGGNKAWLYFNSRATIMIIIIIDNNYSNELQKYVSSPFQTLSSFSYLPDCGSRRREGCTPVPSLELDLTFWKFCLPWPLGGGPCTARSRSCRHWSGWPRTGDLCPCPPLGKRTGKAAQSWWWPSPGWRGGGWPAESVLAEERSEVEMCNVISYHRHADSPVRERRLEPCSANMRKEQRPHGEWCLQAGSK